MHLWYSARENYFESFVVDFQLHLHTLSAVPCMVPWGKSFGLCPTTGWDFLEVVHLCMLGKPLACAFECSDDVHKHQRFGHIQHAMTIAGYTNVVSQNVTAHELTHNQRTRWFGIWLRNDITPQPFTLPKLLARHVEPWHSQKYKFVLPPSIIENLGLDEHLQDVYMGTLDFFPPTKGDWQGL